jgi:colanic acid biosynthesis glycosyl transferase WcaI
MKLLVVGASYSPELIGIAKYSSEMCEWLAGRGHAVKVITSYPHYPEWRVPPPYRNWRYSREVRDGVDVIRCPIYVPAKPTGLRRVLSHLSFALSNAGALMGTALRFRPDIVLVVAPSQLSAPAALTAATVCGARSWLHVQDFEIDTAFGLRLLTANWLRRCAELIEGALLKRFDRVSTISPKMVERLHQKNVVPARALEFRNWVDIAAISPGDRLTRLRAELALPPNAVVALYSGSMALKHGLESVIAAARILHKTNPSVLFVLCGNGELRDGLMQQAGGLDNVRLLDLQPRQRLGELLSTADIHLLPQRAAVADLVLPSKLAAMLASGRPIIAMAEPGTQLAAEVDGCGIVVPAGDPAALAAALVKLASDPVSRVRLGQNARQRAERRWAIETILGQLEQSLLALSPSASTGRTDGAAAGAATAHVQPVRHARRKLDRVGES